MISVIIPSYNSKKTLDQTILSVLSQSYKNFEIIIVDDGSDDGTLDYLNDKYAKNIDNFFIIRQENHGLAHARNTGINNAKGKYIQFLDSDDLLLPSKFEKSIEILETGEDIVSCWCWEMNEMLTQKIRSWKPECSGDIIERLLNQNAIGVVHGPIFRLDILKKAGIRMGEHFGNYCADWFFWFELFMLSPKYSILEEELCIYRRHLGSLTRSNIYNNCLGDLKVQREISQRIKKSQKALSLMPLVRAELSQKTFKCLKIAFKQKLYFNTFFHFAQLMINGHFLSKCFMKLWRNI